MPGNVSFSHRKKYITHLFVSNSTCENVGSSFCKNSTFPSISQQFPFVSCFPVKTKVGLLMICRADCTARLQLHPSYFFAIETKRNETNKQTNKQTVKAWKVDWKWMRESWLKNLSDAKLVSILCFEDNESRVGDQVSGCCYESSFRYIKVASCVRVIEAKIERFASRNPDQLLLIVERLIWYSAH